MSIPTEQQTEIVEPGDDALQLDAVDQKNGQRNFAFSDVVEKRILKVLCAFGRHCCLTLFSALSFLA
jgi:hypothetical protein